MATKSHGRCKVCRAVIHSQHRFGMCAKHGREHYARLQAERQAAKARARARARQDTPTTQSAVSLEEGNSMAEAETPDKAGHRGKPRNLSDEQEVELLDAYTQTSAPLKELAERFGVKETYVYNVLDRAGVSWRRGNPESFEEWQAAQQRKQAEETVPEPVEKALENMLRLPVLPAKPEPVAPTPAVERRVQKWTEVERWMFTVQGLVVIEAAELEDALAQMRRLHPELRITKIELGS